MTDDVRRPDRASRRIAAIAVLVGGASLSLAASCNVSRFPVCRSNDDCPAAEAHVCFDLRCVACHYDRDCPDGNICTSASECSPLSATVSPTPPTMGEAGSAPRDPEGWEACVKACTNKDCVAQCDKKFE